MTLTRRRGRRRPRARGGGTRRGRPRRCAGLPGGRLCRRCRPGLGRRHLRADALILRERHRDGRAWPLGRWRLRRYQVRRAGGPSGLSRLGRCLSWCSGPAVSGAPGSGRLGTTTVAVRRPGRLACEFVFEPADYRRLDCRGRRPNKLTHLLELGHDGLALYAELLREFVNPDLRHCAPSTRPGTTGPVSRPGQRVLRPASACAVHRRMLIGRSLQVSLLSSGASGRRHRQHAYPATRYSPDRYSATFPAGNAAGRRRARGNALRRWARSKHARFRCRYAPRPGSRMASSGTIWSPDATTRTNSALAARSPHPIQVRTGAACLPSSLQGLRASATGRRARSAARFGRRPASLAQTRLSHRARGR